MFLKSLGGPTSQPTFCQCWHQTVVIINRQTNPTRLGSPSSQVQMWTSKQFSHLVSTRSIIGSVSYTRSRKKNWQLNEIIHLLVWCHPKIATTAQAWRLWSATGRDNNTGRGAQREKHFRLVDALCWIRLFKQKGRAGITFSHLFDQSSSPLTFCCTRKQRQDRTWCGQIQEANDRLSDPAAAA